MGVMGSKIMAIPCSLGGLVILPCEQIYSRDRSLATAHTMSHTSGYRPGHRNWREVGKQREKRMGPI